MMVRLAKLYVMTIFFPRNEIRSLRDEIHFWDGCARRERMKEDGMNDVREQCASDGGEGSFKAPMRVRTSLSSFSTDSRIASSPKHSPFFIRLIV